MMTPRLQMKSPCTYNLDEVKSIDIPSYLSRLGFVGGIETAWISCVKRMYEDFEASFAANEGLEAVIQITGHLTQGNKLYTVVGKNTTFL